MSSLNCIPQSIVLFFNIQSSNKLIFFFLFLFKIRGQFPKTSVECYRTNERKGNHNHRSYNAYLRLQNSNNEKENQSLVSCWQGAHRGAAREHKFYHQTPPTPHWGCLAVRTTVNLQCCLSCPSDFLFVQVSEDLLAKQ